MTRAAAAAPLSRRLSYAQCWEDPAVLLDALRPGPEDDVLSIASAGDNVLALALGGARSVVAVDLSLPQLALLELKLAGGRLEYPDFLALLGQAPGRPVELYRSIRSHLSDPARTWWDAHTGLLRRGLLGSGRFERYLSLFRERVLPLVHRRRTVRALLALEDPAAQRGFFERRWNTRAWRCLFRVFFSRSVMAMLGRSPQHFDQVSGGVAQRLLERTEHVLTDLPVRTNPFLRWILQGSYPDMESAHPYLAREGHARLGEVSERVRLVHASLERHLACAPPGAYSAFNLSDMGEYLPPEAWDGLYDGILAAGRPGARLAFWNLFVPRSRPERLRERVRRHPERSEALLRRDRSFFYGAFHLETLA